MHVKLKRVAQLIAPLLAAMLLSGCELLLANAILGQNPGGGFPNESFPEPTVAATYSTGTATIVIHPRSRRGRVVIGVIDWRKRDLA